MGEAIRIMNTQSNRTIDGVVTGSNQVSVVPINQPAIIAAR
jgi:flagella basal body P-ring formation protein FlgA